MSEFTPTLSHFRAVYGEMCADWCRDGSLAEFDRAIDKIKADARIAAWKEAAEFMRTQTSDDETVLRAAHLAATTIYYRASQIEQEET